MEKTGLIDKISKTVTEQEGKDFKGSGVEGQKAAKGDAPEKAKGKTKEAPQGFDKTGATSVVTHRDGPKKVWFRDGKEIGVENA